MGSRPGRGANTIRVTLLRSDEQLLVDMATSLKRFTAALEGRSFLAEDRETAKAVLLRARPRIEEIEHGWRRRKRVVEDFDREADAEEAEIAEDLDSMEVA